MILLSLGLILILKTRPLIFETIDFISLTSISSLLLDDSASALLLSTLLHYLPRDLRIFNHYTIKLKIMSIKLLLQ